MTQINEKNRDIYSNYENRKNHFDVYAEVTQRLISELERGTVPWKQPWLNIKSKAYNRVSRHEYGFINQLLVTHGPGEYATFRQWTELFGGHIKKGERADTVVFFKFPDAEPDTDVPGAGDETQKSQKKNYPVLRTYKVFHISQVENVTPLPLTEPLYEHKPMEAAEFIFRSFTEQEGITVKEDLGNHAYYQPASDTIVVPALSQFADVNAGYGVRFHEMLHSTGHSSRLNRVGLKHISFGSEEYSKEELISEIGSTFLLNTLGMDSTIANSAAYIDGWLNALRRDKYLVVSAAGQAEKACKYIFEHIANSDMQQVPCYR